MTPLVLALFLFVRQEDAVGHFLESGDYRAAWECTKAEPDPSRQLLLETRIHYAAGDPARALASARRGLQLSPRSLDLIYYAAGAAIWIQDGVVGGEYAKQLALELARSPSLSSVDRERWQAVASDFAARSAQIVEHGEALHVAVRHARWAAIGGITLGIACCWLASRVAQGKSSNPVS